MIQALAVRESLSSCNSFRQPSSPYSYVVVAWPHRRCWCASWWCVPLSCLKASMADGAAATVAAQLQNTLSPIRTTRNAGRHFSRHRLPTRLAHCTRACCRSAAETALQGMKGHPGFAMALLSIVHNQAGTYPVGLQQAAALYFKNLAKEGWQRVSARWYAITTPPASCTDTAYGVAGDSRMRPPSSQRRSVRRSKSSSLTSCAQCLWPSNAR